MAELAVLHVITKLELGGAQQNTLFIVENLDRSRFAPMLMSGPGGILDAEAAKLPEKGIPYTAIPHMRRSIRPWSDYRAYRELRRAIRRASPAIVHTHSSKAGILGRLAAAAERVPVVMHTIHGFGIGAVRNPLVQRLLLTAERRAARATTHFVPVSRENFEVGKSYGLLDESNATVILEGADLSPFRNVEPNPALRAEFGFPEGAPVVGMVACFKPQKDPLTFIEAAARVHAQVPEARFLMVGDGELRGDIEEGIAARGLEGVVAPAGWRHDVPQLFRMMSVSVLTSLWEGLPRVIPQSLASGVPVVVTDAGGSSEAVVEGETGFVLPKGDTEGIAAKIVYLLRNPEIARNMGKAGPTSVGRFDAPAMVRAHESLYLKLLQEKGVDI